MVNQGLSKYGLRLLDTLTDWSPTIVPKLFQSMFLAVVGNGFSNRIVQRSYARKLSKVKRFEKLLVIVDVNIGDAVIMQSTVHALKGCFPEAKIDYVCSATGGSLVQGMPGVHHIYNIFTQFGNPSEGDLTVLRGIIQREKHDVIFNLCGFLNPDDLQATGVTINLYMPWAWEIARRWRGGKGKLHLTYIVDTVLRSLIAEAKSRNKEPKQSASSLPRESQASIIHGSAIYLTHDAILEACTFLSSQGLLGAQHLVMLHADAPFQWTQIPLVAQSRFLQDVLEAHVATKVLLSCGNARNDLGSAVLRQIPAILHDRVIIVPPMSIAAHAALIDACDVFVSGDTGNMHIAAARKIPLHTKDTFRNTTAVVGVFGATDSRMSGYDSSLPEHLSGEQDAPAKVFVAPAPCRNISCIDKPGKTCGEVRCFEGLDAHAMATFVNVHLQSLREKKKSILDSAKQY